MNSGDWPIACISHPKGVGMIYINQGGYSRNILGDFNLDGSQTATMANRSLKPDISAPLKIRLPFCLPEDMVRFLITPSSTVSE
jgi:hypothetical protein